MGKSRVTKYELDDAKEYAVTDTKDFDTAKAAIEYVEAQEGDDEFCWAETMVGYQVTKDMGDSLDDAPVLWEVTGVDDDGKLDELDENED